MCTACMKQLVVTFRRRGLSPGLRDDLLRLLLSHFGRVPIDGSPPGSAVPAILQARTVERVAISFSSV